MVDERAVRVSVVSMDGEPPEHPISWVTTEGGDHIPDTPADPGLYTYIVHVPVTDPPPEHGAAILRIMRRELQMQLGKGVSVVMVGTHGEHDPDFPDVDPASGDEAETQPLDESRPKKSKIKKGKRGKKKSAK